MAGLQVFQVWLDRGVLARKVLEPHLEQLKTHPVIAAPANEPDDELMQPTKLGEFGCALLPSLPAIGPFCAAWPDSVSVLVAKEQGLQRQSQTALLIAGAETPMLHSCLM